jgi:hypothetical protein
MLAAADHITLDQTWSGAIQELNLADGQTIEQEWISDGGGPMKATICWTDLPGTPVPLSLDPPNRMLVNDLDLRIIGPDAAVYEPWILDPANPADAATTGNNDRDNVEVVLLDPAPGGRYTIQISHAGTLSGGSQDFALILSVGSGAPSACPADEVEDCFGNCAPVDWIGDGYCDDGSYSYGGNPIDFNCSEFAFDGGDCAASPVAYILWRHQASGNNTVWMMNGSTIEPGSGPMQTLADTDWTLCGMGDFNGDGEAYDLLWRHAVNGKNTIWLMHGRSILPDSGSLTKVADMDWIIAGTGDFNGDGKADILWRHLGTGKNVVWLMNGTTILPGGGYLTKLSDQGWTVAGTGDFNGDGNSDILWRHTVAGKNVVWLMDGTTILPASGSLLKVADLDWTIVGTDDFNGDGNADILWRHLVTGKNALWIMDGATILPASGLTLKLADLNWAIVGTRDFDGDGNADILWRQVVNGKNALWLMDGTTLLGSIALTSVPDTSWSVVATAE